MKIYKIIKIVSTKESVEFDHNNHLEISFNINGCRRFFKISILLALLLYLNMLVIIPASADSDLAEQKMVQINKVIQEIFSDKDHLSERKLTEDNIDNIYKCATPIIHYALNHKEFLWPENSFILYRPTNPDYEYYYRDVKVSWFDSSNENNPGESHFRIHYTENDKYRDAVPLDKSAGNPNIPDYVENLAFHLEEVWDKILDMGYSSPKMDGNIGGGYNKLDVYVFELNKSSYGYTSLDEDDNIYICIDDNLLPDKMKVTVAHEFFHAVQYVYEDWYDSDRYHYDSNLWWEESTAVWIEDEIYDYVNDYLQYLKIKFTNFDKPLDYYQDTLINFEYGGVIFAKFLSETFNKDIILEIFVRCREINPPLAKYAIGDILNKYVNEKTTDGWEITLEEFYIKNLKRDYEDGYELLNNEPGQLVRTKYPVPSFMDTINIEGRYNSDWAIEHLAAHYFKLISTEKVNNLYLSIHIPTLNKSVNSILLAEDKITKEPILDPDFVDPNKKNSFIIRNFGESGTYSEAYLIVINSDPINTRYYSLITDSEPMVFENNSLNNQLLNNQKGCYINSLL